MAYLVMEYLPGITLRELLREQRRLTMPQTITIMDAILSGLAAAHRAGIVHRDVKPENVLLAEDGRIKIGDFGLARATTANTATGAQLLGTIAYLAPELVTRGMADARSDIYSLGIMLYEMLVGEQPYKGEQPMQIAFQHATDSVPRPEREEPRRPRAARRARAVGDREVARRAARPTRAEMLDRLREIERELGIAPQVARTALGRHHPRRGRGRSGRPHPGAARPTMTGADGRGRRHRQRHAPARARRSAAPRKGGWLIALVLLLAALAAGVGWWFGSGPGSQVAVPDVANRSFAEAQQILAEQSLSGRPEGRLRPRRRRRRGRRHRSAGRARGSTRTRRSRCSSRRARSRRRCRRSPGLTRGRCPRHPAGRSICTVAEPDQEYFTDAAAGTVICVAVTPARGRRRRSTARRAAPRSRATPRRCRSRSGRCPTCTARASIRRPRSSRTAACRSPGRTRSSATTSTPVWSSTSPSARAAAAGARATA